MLLTTYGYTFLGFPNDTTIHFQIHNRVRAPGEYIGCIDGY